MADGSPLALENEAETETCMPDDEFLVFQAEVMAMDRSFKDAPLKTLEFSKEAARTAEIGVESPCKRAEDLGHSQCVR